jgi:hypothetical protein
MWHEEMLTDTLLGPHKIKELLMCSNKKQTVCVRQGRVLVYH